MSDPFKTAGRDFHQALGRALDDTSSYAAPTLSDLLNTDSEARSYMETTPLPTEFEAAIATLADMTPCLCSGGFTCSRCKSIETIKATIEAAARLAEKHPRGDGRVIADNIRALAHDNSSNHTEKK